MIRSPSLSRSPTKFPPPPPRKRSMKTKLTEYNPTVWIIDNLQMSITSDLDHSDVDLYVSSPVSAPVSPMITQISNHLQKENRSLSVQTRNKPKNSLATQSINTSYTSYTTSKSKPSTPSFAVPSLKSVNKHKAKLIKQRRRQKIRKNKRNKHKKYVYNDDIDGWSSSDSDSNSSPITRHGKTASVPNINISFSDFKRKKNRKTNKKRGKNGKSEKLKVVKDDKISRLRHTRSFNAMDEDGNKSQKRSNTHLRRNTLHTNYYNYKIKAIPSNVDDQSYWSNMDYRNIKPRQRKVVKNKKSRQKYPTVIST